jgi:integrase
MAELSWHSGMRPGEVVQMSMAGIDQSPSVWLYTPPRHKTEHHGRGRRVDLGPKAQEVLRPWLRVDGKPLFSPAEWEEKRNADRRAKRATPMTPSQSRRGRKPSRKRAPKATYTVESYCRAVARACEKAGIDSWSPNQIRHAFATRVRAEFGLEGAQVSLGHAKADVTQVYAEKNAKLSRQIAEKMG